MSKYSSQYGPLHGNRISVGVQAAGNLLQGQGAVYTHDGEVVMPNVFFSETEAAPAADNPAGSQAEPQTDEVGSHTETHEERLAVIDEARTAVRSAYEQGDS